MYDRHELKQLSAKHAHLFCSQVRETQEEVVENGVIASEEQTAVLVVLDVIPLIAESRHTLRQGKHSAELVGRLEKTMSDIQFRPGKGTVLSRLTVKSCAALVKAFKKVLLRMETNRNKPASTPDSQPAKNHPQNSNVIQAKKSVPEKMKEPKPKQKPEVQVRAAAESKDTAKVNA